MRKVFLDELPRWKSGVNKFKINWKEAIGYKVHFIYDDIEGEIEIVDYNTNDQRLTVKYKDRVKPINSSCFVKCSLGNILGKKTNDFKIEIGTTFKDEKRNLTIIDREIRDVKIKDKKCKKGYTIKNRKYYKYHCNIDCNEDWIEEYNLLNGQGCNVCRGNKVTEYNCIWNTDRELCISLGVPEEIAKSVTWGSGIPIIFNCKCGNEVTIKPSNIISNKSIGCKNCGDGISYPNKYKREFYNQLLEQCQIKSFETEYKIEDKKYDIFVELNNGKTLIDENHGCQHGEFIYCGDLLLVKETKGFGKRDEIKNDIYKCKLAYENGIDNYIQTDCTLSNPEYIKHSIKNSWLSDMFDLSKIDWNKCDEYALKNMVKEVCNYWYKHREINKEDINITNLINIFNLSNITIRKYLKKGTEIGWCNYNPKEENKRTSSKNGKLSSKTILMYDKDMNFIGEYESAVWIDRNSKELFGVRLNSRGISPVATGKRPYYKGFIFKHKECIDK